MTLLAVFAFPSASNAVQGAWTADSTGTKLYDAIYEAIEDTRDYVTSSRGLRCVVVVSDGKDVDNINEGVGSSRSRHEFTSLAGGNGIRTFTVGVGSNQRTRRAFVYVCYKYSPPLARRTAEHPIMRKIIRIGLHPVLELSKWFVGESSSQLRAKKIEKIPSVRIWASTFRGLPSFV